MTKPSVALGGVLHKLGCSGGRRADRGAASTAGRDSVAQGGRPCSATPRTTRPALRRWAFVLQPQAEAPVRRGADAEALGYRPGGPPTPAQRAFSAVGQFGARVYSSGAATTRALITRAGASGTG